MSDPGALRGPNNTERLRNPDSFGVSGAASPDGVQTIELTPEPSVHGPHGAVRIRFVATSEPTLTAEISWGNHGRAMCRSADSIRLWGAFSPDVDVSIRAPGQVRLIARSGAGALLAGPTVVSSALGVTAFEW